MKQDVPASQEWWEVFWVSRVQDRPLEATSSEEVKAAFVSLLSLRVWSLSTPSIWAQDRLSRRDRSSAAGGRAETHHQQFWTSRSDVWSRESSKCARLRPVLQTFLCMDWWNAQEQRERKTPPEVLITKKKRNSWKNGKRHFSKTTTKKQQIRLYL